MLGGVGLPLQWPAGLFYLSGRSFSQRQRNHRIPLAMAAQEGCRTRPLASPLEQGIGDRQVGGKDQDASDRRVLCKPDMVCHGSSLGETGQDQALVRNTQRTLFGDQFLDQGRTLMNPGLIDSAIDGNLEDVVPGAHHHAVVDGDRSSWSVWEDEADRVDLVNTEFGNDRFEIMTVCAQAVEPDDRSSWISPVSITTRSIELLGYSVQSD